MPVAPTFPGVYIEEIPSGVRTITGVATSITAFVGRALRGPVNDPKTINSFGDFERIFGGLWDQSSLGFAVRDFYLNGGQQAIIDRLFHPTFVDEPARQLAKTAAEAVAKAANDSAGTTPQAVADDARTKAKTFTTEPQATAADTVAKAAEAAAKVTGAKPQDVKDAAAKAVGAAAARTRASLTRGPLTLEAANEGTWGNSLRIRVTDDINQNDPDKANLFNLFVRDGSTGQTEVFRNVSITTTSPRFVNNVLANGSDLVRVVGPGPATVPAKHDDPAAGKDPFDPTVSGTSTGVAEEAGDGNALNANDFKGSEANKTGIFALEKADLFNLLCIPLSDDDTTYKALLPDAVAYCQKRRAMMIVDPPSGWTKKDQAKNNLQTDIGITSKNAAIYFPRLRQPNPIRDGQVEDFPPCGAVAGVMARTDTDRGVWKAPAGLAANFFGVPELSVSLTDPENGELNPLGINCLRAFPAAGRVIWGARTLEGADRLASEWKYVPVRRTALFIEESLYRGTQWVVFEPNDEPLWSQIRLNVGAFMHNLFRQGAFQGTTPREAYFVKCDKETTTQNDINLGIVNIVVGFAPLKPAEFVIIKLQQMAGQIET